MRPVLFEIFGVPLPSFVVAVALGYLVALWSLLRLTPKGAPAVAGGLERAQVWDLYIVMLVSSLMGSKIGHTLFEARGHLDEHGQPVDGLVGLLEADPWHWMRLGEPGYVWYGGMIGALLVAVIYFVRRPQLRAWLYADLFAPAVMAGAAVGRVGCFLAGCCYGRPTDLPWGVVFPDTKGPAHPTQLYDAAAALAIALILGHRFARRRFEGENIALLLVAYPVLRSITEIFRGDAERGGIGVMSTSQLLSIPVLAAGIAIYVRRSRSVVPAQPGASELASNPG